jgi:hypothetical protein
MANSVAYALPLITKTLRLACSAGKERLGLVNPVFSAPTTDNNLKRTLAWYDDHEVQQAELAIPSKDILTKVEFYDALNLRSTLELNLFPGIEAKSNYLSVLITKQFEVYDNHFAMFESDSTKVFFLWPSLNKIGQDLIETVNRIHVRTLHSQLKPLTKYTGLVVPKISMDVEFDLPFLQGLGIGEYKAEPKTRIRSAVQEISFNVHPIKRKIGVSLIGAPQVHPLVISSEFTMWVTRGPSLIPQLVANVNEDSFTVS